MRVRIHFTLFDDSEDSMIIEGDTIEELREIAASEVAKRGGTNPRSEEIE